MMKSNVFIVAVILLGGSLANPIQGYGDAGRRELEVRVSSLASLYAILIIHRIVESSALPRCGFEPSASIYCVQL